MTRRRLSPALVAAVAVAAAAAVLTFVRLGEPAGIVFDETYYVEDARSMLATGVEGSFAVHPPLGKWVVAVGMALVGDTPAGWRAGGAFLSVLAVAATVEIGRRLTGRVFAGIVAGGLLLLDGVWLTLARLAMLDSTLAALVTFGTLALVVDHQRATARVSDVVVATGRDGDGVSSGRIVAPAVSRWPLWSAGVLFGLAGATKWSGALALAGAGLLALGWEVAARRRRGGSGATHGRGSLGRDLGRDVGRVALALGVVPLVVYAATWLPWLVAYASTSTASAVCAPDDRRDPDCDPPWSERVVGFGRHHRDVARFHLGLDADHPYRAPATTWPAQLRPVVAHYERCSTAGTTPEGETCLGRPGRVSEVAVLGNPAVWWSGLLLVPLSAAALRRRDGAAVVPLVLLGAQFLPWLVAGRPVFSFYAGPLVPALTIAIAVACVELDRPARRAATSAVGTLAATVAGGALLLAGTSRAAAITAAVLTGTAGVAAGSAVDARRERARGVPEGAPPVGTVTSVLVLAAAAALLVYLSPLWFAVPVDDQVLRQRWWLRSWV